MPTALKNKRWDGIITFSFRAICIVQMSKSPLRPDDKVKILEMAPEEDCEHEMFVETTWRGRSLAFH